MLACGAESGLACLSMSLPTKKARKEFQKMDQNGGGIVLFDEFCVWYTKQAAPERAIAASSTKFVFRAVDEIQIFH